MSCCEITILFDVFGNNCLLISPKIYTDIPNTYVPGTNKIDRKIDVVDIGSSNFGMSPSALIGRRHPLEIFVI